jgi:hypothetical protein
MRTKNQATAGDAVLAAEGLWSGSKPKRAAAPVSGRDLEHAAALEKMARLRALRLAKEAEGKEAAAASPPRKAARTAPKH